MTDSYKDIVVSDPVTPFGEVSVAEDTPVVQLDATLGLKTQQEVEVYTGTTGSVAVEDTGTGYEWRCQTGTDVGGYGIVRSQNAVAYKPGQGSVYRFTARFDEGVALSSMRAGAIAVGNELSFGYNGVDFGILHRTAGKLEIRKLTITAAASGNETATVTLNDIEYTVSLTSGTIVHTCVELAADDYNSVWVATSNDETVLFIGQAVGAQSGTYSFSSTGTAAGTFEQVAAGADVVDTWYLQEEWNVNRCDGSGPFPMVLNPQNGNVFQIKQQYLGYGNIDFHIENPANGKFQMVHRIHYSNNYQSPSLMAPSFKMGVFAASIGSTTNLNAYMASMFGANQGKSISTINPDSHGNTNTNVTTTTANILSIRVRPEINGIIQLREIKALLATFASDGTKPAVVYLYLNPTLSGDPDWQYHEGNTTDAITEVMTTTVDVDVNDGVTLELGTFGLARVDSEVVDLEKLGITVKRNDVLTLAAQSTSGSTEITGSLIWKVK